MLLRALSFAALAALLAVVGCTERRGPPGGGDGDGGTGGVFDPTVSHSGANGFTTGNYVLNVWTQADEAPPLVVAATPSDGDTLAAPPQSLLVEFNEPVNLPWLYQNYQQPAQGDPTAVFIRGADGIDYSPRLVSYSNDTNQAEFLLIDTNQPPKRGAGQPPERIDQFLINAYRETGCAGWEGYSHYMMAAWPTDEGQRIGPAVEVEGGGSSAVPSTTGTPTATRAP